MTVQYHTINGVQMPRVTALLHEFLPEPAGLTKWKANKPDHEEYSNGRATIGTMCHFRIAAHLASLHGLEPPALELDAGAAFIDEDKEDDIEVIMSYFEDFAEEHKLQPHAIERSLHHHQYLYCGQADFIGEFDGMKVVLDWKTAPRIYEHYEAQMLAYKRAILSAPQPVLAVDKCVIVSLNQKTGITFQIVNNEKAAWDMFWGCYDGWQKANKPEREWKEKD